MVCDRCRNPNVVDVHEYTITKTAANGEDVKEKRVFCGSCAEITKDAGFKLTGGKREAEPEASTEDRDEIPAESRYDGPPPEAEARPARGRRS